MERRELSFSRRHHLSPTPPGGSERIRNLSSISPSADDPFFHPYAEERKSFISTDRPLHALPRRRKRFLVSSEILYSSSSSSPSIKRRLEREKDLTTGDETEEREAKEGVGGEKKERKKPPLIDSSSSLRENEPSSSSSSSFSPGLFPEDDEDERKKESAKKDEDGDEDDDKEKERSARKGSEPALPCGERAYLLGEMQNDTLTKLVSLCPLHTPSLLLHSSEHDSLSFFNFL